MESQIRTIPFGKTKQGQEVTLYRIYNNAGSYIEVLDYGCTVMGMYVHQRDQKLRNVLCGCGSLEECEQAAIQTGAVEAEGGWGISLCKQIWQVQLAEDHTVVFSACEVGNSCKIDAVVKFRMKDFDRLVIDYSARTGEGNPVALTHKLCFSLDDQLMADSHKMRVFVQREADDAGKSVPLRSQGSSAIDYTPLQSGKHLYLSEQAMIHPFIELASDQTELALTAYSTMPAMEMAVCGDPWRGVCFKACGSGTRAEERTVYGIDLLYHPEDKVQANPFMLFMPG